MLEKEQEWRQFRNLMVASGLGAEAIHRETRIPMSVVSGYADQFSAALVFRTLSNTIPVALKKFAVGFRYQHLNRWMDTPAEKRAREDYDAGLVEVMQGKFKVGGEDAYVLFSIPRRVRDVKRQPYFAAPVYP